MKPALIAVMDGIVMGGGVGISVHAPIKIATENSMFAMPEARIGFFTDVGGGYFLSRLRSNIGLYLGLTGARLKGKDLVAAGIANYYVPRDKLHLLQQDIMRNLTDSTQVDDIHRIVSSHAQHVHPLLSNENEINTLFAAQSFSDILNNIESSQTEFAKNTHKLIKE